MKGLNVAGQTRQDPTRPVDYHSVDYPEVPQLSGRSPDTREPRFAYRVLDRHRCYPSRNARHSDARSTRCRAHSAPQSWLCRVRGSDSRHRHRLEHGLVRGGRCRNSAPAPVCRCGPHRAHPTAAAIPSGAPGVGDRRSTSRCARHRRSTTPTSVTALRRRSAAAPSPIEDDTHTGNARCSTHAAHRSRVHRGGCASRL